MTSKDSRASESPPSASGGRPKRRLWRWILLGVVILLVLVVLIGPYIASMGPARGIIVGTLNDLLKGTFHLDEVSLSWFGPCTVRGLRVVDPQGREVLSVGEAKLVPGLWGLLWSWENFQWVGVDGAETALHVDADGNVSLLEAFTLREPGPEKPLPDLHGTVNIKDASARIVLHDGRILAITRMTAKVAVDTLSTISGDIEADLGETGALNTRFVLTNLLRDGKMHPLHATVDLDVSTAEGRDIALKPLLSMVTDRATFGGRAKLSAKIKGSPLTPEGAFELTLGSFTASTAGGSVAEAVDLKLGGRFVVAEGDPDRWGKLPGTDKRTAAGEVTLTGDPGTVRVDLAWPLAMPPFEVRPTREQWMTALLTGDDSALPHFTVGVTGDVDLARLARAVPALLSIRPGVRVTSGRLTITDFSVRLDATPVATGTVTLKDLQAERDGRATPLPQLIRFGFDAVLDPGKGLRVRDADLASEFVKIDTTGDLNRVQAVFQADLAGLYGQLNQVFEMGTFELAGITGGTVTAARGADDVARLELKDLTARDLRYRKDARLLELESAQLTAAGDLRLEGGVLKRVDVTLQEMKAAKLRYVEESRRLDLASVSASGKADVTFEKPPADSPVTALSPAKVVVHEGTVEIDGTTSVSGSGSLELKTGAVDVTLEVPRADLARLVQTAGGLGLPAGELGRWGGSLEARNVRLSRTRADGPITLPGPATATLRNPTLDGKTLDLEKVDVTWTGVELDPTLNALSAASLKVNSDVAVLTATELAAGWGEALSLSGKANVQADIDRALGILARVTRSGAAPGMSGRLDWSGEFSSTPPGVLAGRTVTVKSAGKVDNFAVRSGNTWERIGTVTFAQDADATFKDDKLERLTVRESRVDMPGKLVAVTSGTHVASIGALEADLDVQRADLGYLARLLYDEKGTPRPPFDFDLPAAFGTWTRELRRYAGTATLKTSVKQASSKTPMVSTGTCTVAGASLDGRPLSTRDVLFEWRNVKIAFEKLEAEWLKADVGVASASASAFSLTTGDALQVTGQVHVMSDLAGTMDLVKRAVSAYPIARTLETALPPMAGRLDWTGTFTSAGAATTFNGEGTLDDLRVGTGPTAFSDRKVTFNNQVELETETKTFTVRQLLVRATPIGLSVAGTVREYDGRRILNLAGRYQGDWERVMPLVYQFVPKARGNVALAGDASGSFTVQGPLNDPTVKPVWRGIEGSAQAGWTTARILAISDVTFGKGTISATAKDGIVRIPVTEIPAGEGKVRVGAVIDGRTDPGIFYIPGKLQAIENFKFDKEFGKKFLSMINPIFGGNVQGLASVMVQDVRAPLDDPKTAPNELLKNMSGSGRLDLYDLQVESKGFLDVLVQLVGLGGDGVYQVPHTGTDFVIRGGRIYYKDFVVPMRKNFDFIFSGSIGLADNQLDMVVSVPVTPNLLRSSGAGGQADDMARVLTIRVDFKITGTSDSPKITPQFNPASLLQNALRALMLDRLGGLLKPK